MHVVKSSQTLFRQAGRVAHPYHCSTCACAYRPQDSAIGWCSVSLEELDYFSDNFFTTTNCKSQLNSNRWAFCLRMREMRRTFRVRRHLLFLNALRRVFKRAIYVVRKIVSREMKDYSNFTHISNTLDIHCVCRDFGWGYINHQSANRTR